MNASPQGEPGLVIRTHFDEAGDLGALVENQRPSSPHYILKYRRYPSGHAELTAVKVTEPIFNGGKKKNRQEEQEKRPRAETNIGRSVRRARTTVRRKALTMKADRMWTLTYRENKTDRDLSFKDFLKFVRYTRERFPDFQYIAVAERQKRGAWHFHIASNKFYPVKILNAIWQRVVGRNNGNVDIEYRKQCRNSNGISPVKIARYMSKYITKGFNETGTIEDEHIPGANRYRVSHGITDPVQTGYMALAPFSDSYLLAEIFTRISGSLPSSAWENEFCLWLSNFDST